MRLFGLVSLAITFCLSACEKDSLYVTAGVAQSIGRRPTMEDAHALRLSIRGYDHLAYFGIFDGHGTSQVAQFVAKHLLSEIMAVPAFEEYLSKALTIGYKRVDSRLQKSSLKFEAFFSGTCAVTAFIDLYRRRLHIAHVGDSRAVLSRKGKAIPLTSDHSPDRQDERKRIESMGGKVEFRNGPRIGGLAVSRALGDHGLRSKGVISIPEVTLQGLSSEDEFLILACDGIFEKNLSCQDAVTIVANSLRKNKYAQNPAQIAAHDLIQAAYDDDSGDNLSALVVLFNYVENKIV